ncbi:hypothetical protein [Nocardioides plantarum]|uniref:Uncharacterized protein n=1 Tax=Nocardioides plantarum TaxID=29299 RepID=A0ABV5KGV2_9ACTN|nr:hypothetical protein [Nocardioides plantarum]
MLRTWLLAHHIERRWVLVAVGSWVALWGFASITVPLKYPYEARGQVFDSGVVIGLLIPLAVMNLALDEGPADLVRSAARRLTTTRIALITGYLLTAALFSTAMAWAVALPIALVLADTLLLAGVNIAGNALLGTRLGWLPAAATAFTMSAPGLVPFEANLLYNRDVSSTFVIVIGATVVVAAAAYARAGAVGLLGRTSRATPE